MIKVDVKELEEFKQNIGNFGHKVIARKLANEAAQRLHAKIVKRTPVGQKPSFEQFATGRKPIAEQKADYNDYWQGYVGGTLRKAWKIHPAKKIATGYEVTVENPMEYASFVEFDHKQRVGRYVPQINKKLKKELVKGQYFMTKSENELRRELPSILSEKMKEVLNEVFE